MDNKKIYWVVITKIILIALYSIVFFVYANYRSSNAVFIVFITTILINSVYVMSLIFFIMHGSNLHELRFGGYVVIFLWVFMLNAMITSIVLILDLAKLEFLSLFWSLLVWETVCIISLFVIFLVISILFFIIYIRIVEHEEQKNGDYNNIFQRNSHHQNTGFSPEYKPVPINNQEAYYPVNYVQNALLEGNGGHNGFKQNDTERVELFVTGESFNN